MRGKQICLWLYRSERIDYPPGKRSSFPSADLAMLHTQTKNNPPALYQKFQVTIRPYPKPFVYILHLVQGYCFGGLAIRGPKRLPRPTLCGM